ncbi:MAG: TIR domain-containing protein [Planctomycetota bacterium]
MAHRELHEALRTETLGTCPLSTGHTSVIRLQNSKTDIRHSVHVTQTSWGMSGALQTGDILAWLRFSAGECTFTPSRECFVREVGEDFDLAGFCKALDEAHQEALAAERDLDLQRCGFYLPHPMRTRGPEPGPFGMGGGDGHRASKIEVMKNAADEVFSYVLTWLDGGSQKGWTIHYIPKNPPLDDQLAAACEFLGLSTFGVCPENGFEPCIFRFTPFDRSPRHFTGSNANQVHGWFDHHQSHFLSGLRHLINADSLMRPFGMGFLLPTSFRTLTQTQPTQAMVPHTPQARSKARADALPDHFDVALSFAGAQRDLAETLHAITKEAGYVVFYDSAYQAELWGADPPRLFDEIYRVRSRFCVIFVSQEYLDGEWTDHERQSAIARALKEKGRDYILPVKIHDVLLPGIAPTIGYVSLSEKSIEEVGTLLIEKLRAAQ